MSDDRDRGRVRVRDRVRFRFTDRNRRSEAINFGAIQIADLNLTPCLKNILHEVSSAISVVFERRLMCI